MDKTPSRKKRARSSHSPDDDGEDKKRGRPRVEKQDESAADVGTFHFSVILPYAQA